MQFDRLRRREFIDSPFPPPPLDGLAREGQRSIVAELDATDAQVTNASSMFGHRIAEMIEATLPKPEKRGPYNQGLVHAVPGIYVLFLRRGDRSQRPRGGIAGRVQSLVRW